MKKSYRTERERGIHIDTGDRSRWQRRWRQKWH